MPRQGSDMMDFLQDALKNNKYCNLKWHLIDKIFCFTPVNKNNRDWKEEYGFIYEDWHSFKPRRDEDCTLVAMRQRFSQALNKSPYLKKIKKISTSSEYYYEIIHKRKKFCNLNAVEEMQCCNTGTNDLWPPDTNGTEPSRELETDDPNPPLSHYTEYSSNFKSPEMNLCCDKDLPILDDEIFFNDVCDKQNHSEACNPTADERSEMINALDNKEDSYYVNVDADGLIRLIATSSMSTSNNSIVLTITKKVMEDLEKLQTPNLTDLTKTVPKWTVGTSHDSSI